MTIPSFKRAELSQLFSRGDLWFGESEGSNKASAPDQCYAVNKRLSGSRLTATLSLGSTEIDNALPQGGLQLGAIHEFFLQDPEHTKEIPLTIPTIIARSLIEHLSNAYRSPWGSPTHTGSAQDAIIAPHLFLWIGKQCWPTPFVLPKEHLAQCFFINPPSRELLLWSIDTALRSPSVKCVVADCRDVAPSLLRRFQFAARTSGATAFLLRPGKSDIPPSCAHTQWSIAPTPSQHENPTWQLTLVRAKGGLHKQVSWVVSAESEYEQGEKVSIRILSELVNGCSDTSTYKQEQEGFSTAERISA